MTQQEINDYNERCLQILGRKLSEIEIKYIDEHTHLQEYRDAEMSDLQFHSDWNWIMEVVEAIENLGFATKIDHDYCISNYGCDRCEIDIRDNALMLSDEDEMDEPIVFKLTTSKKEATVQAIDKFLIWYEENNG
jgi:hypothetical protein